MIAERRTTTATTTEKEDVIALKALLLQLLFQGGIAQKLLQVQHHYESNLHYTLDQVLQGSVQRIPSVGRFQFWMMRLLL